ncbi:MAG: hypothetical protein H8E55_68995, partial [Pelagibacterales bacterium]|nr:hypothetical protein [Pelagibacterales bacterium]
GAFSGYDQLTAQGNNESFIGRNGLFQDPGADGVEEIPVNEEGDVMFDQWGEELDGDDKCAFPALSVPFPIQTIGDSLVSDAGAFVLAETSLNMHCWGQNPVVTAKLQLNGQDRFSEREGTYFDLVQPYQHHTRSPDTGINVYSFALRPEEHQPSGTCNFSRIDNATLQLVLSTNAIGGDETAKVRVYATNYNVLRVMSGMGGLAYSN